MYPSLVVKPSGYPTQKTISLALGIDEYQFRKWKASMSYSNTSRQQFISDTAWTAPGAGMGGEIFNTWPAYYPPRPCVPKNDNRQGKYIFAEIVWIHEYMCDRHRTGTRA